jgi:hypothetical protein
LKIDYWEVLNEEDEGNGHEIDPETYTALYDEVVSALRKVDPTMKFSGLALADASSLHYFEYFLTHKNHGPGIPLNMVSYHKYVFAEAGRTLRDWQHDMFGDADRFLHTVEQIERIRKRLSPDTNTGRWVRRYLLTLIWVRFRRAWIWSAPPNWSTILETWRARL